MTELERRALLGDKRAQEECTKNGIILPCMRCYGKVEIESFSHNGSEMEMEFKCERCGISLSYSQYILKKGIDESTVENPSPLSQYNTRPAPPIGRCLECKHYDYDKEFCGKNDVKMFRGYFCSYFDPKEREENAVD